jgi:hypothetical protein
VDLKLDATYKIVQAALLDADGNDISSRVSINDVLVAVNGVPIHEVQSILRFQSRDLCCKTLICMDTQFSSTRAALAGPQDSTVELQIHSKTARNIYALECRYVVPRFVGSQTRQDVACSPYLMHCSWVLEFLKTS